MPGLGRLVADHVASLLLCQQGPGDSRGSGPRLLRKARTPCVCTEEGGLRSLGCPPRPFLGCPAVPGRQLEASWAGRTLNGLPQALWLHLGRPLGDVIVSFPTVPQRSTGKADEGAREARAWHGDQRRERQGDPVAGPSKGSPCLGPQMPPAGGCTRHETPGDRGLWQFPQRTVPILSILGLPQREGHLGKRPPSGAGCPAEQRGWSSGAGEGPPGPERPAA